MSGENFEAGKHWNDKRRQSRKSQSKKGNLLASPAQKAEVIRRRQAGEKTGTISMYDFIRIFLMS